MPNVNYFDVDKEMSWYCDNEKKLTKKIHRPHRGKKVHQYTIDGVFVKEWISQRHASNSLGNDCNAVHKCLKGKQHTAFGYRWEYAPTT